MPTASMVLVPPEREISVDDPVRVEHRAVIDLFANQLASLTFPDVDAALLQRQAEDVRAEAVAVAKAAAALEAAQKKLADRNAILGETVARGLAYARIYADAHPDRHALASTIAAVSTPALPPAAAPKKRRGRPPRQSAELFAMTEESSS